jgi:hypothetical protein
MTGFIVLLLAVAIPLGIVVFTVMATEAERKVYERAPISRFSAALLFGLAAVLGIVWVFRGTGPEYASAMAVLLSIPAAAIAALLALASHRFLVGRSTLIAALLGAGIALLTAAGTSSLVAVILAPDEITSFVSAFGIVIVLSPSGVPVLLIGGLAGFLLSHLSNRKRPNTPLNPDAPTSGAPVS